MNGRLDGISDAQVIEIAKYFSALELKPLRVTRDESLYTRGAKISREMLCGTCHLPDYRGRDQIPRLAGQREDYLLHSMRQFRNNEAFGRDTIMAASLYGIADGDLQALAHYLSQAKVD